MTKELNWYKEGAVSGNIAPPYRVANDCDPIRLWVKLGRVGSEITVDVFDDGVSILRAPAYLHRSITDYETEFFVGDTDGATIKAGSIITVSVTPDKGSPGDISVQLVLEED